MSTEFITSSYSINHINDAHYVACDGLRHAVACGIFLVECRKQFSSGIPSGAPKLTFDEFLEGSGIEMSPAHAARYMNLAEDISSEMGIAPSFELARSLLEAEISSTKSGISTLCRKIRDLIFGKDRRSLITKVYKTRNATKRQNPYLVENSLILLKRRRSTCERIYNDLRYYMLEDLSWADQESDFIERLLALMMEINALMRQSLRERGTETAARIFIRPKNYIHELTTKETA